MMLTVITDDLVIDMEQVLYLSNDGHPYTLRFRGGAELELTLAEGEAVIAKLKEGEKTVGHALVPEYPGGCDLFETPITDSATVSDTCCDNEAEIDPDEYLHAIKACGVPVEAKAKLNESEWIEAQQCEAGVFYITKYGQKILCARPADDNWNPRFVTQSMVIISYDKGNEMLRSNVQSW